MSRPNPAPAEAVTEPLGSADGADNDLWSNDSREHQVAGGLGGLGGGRYWDRALVSCVSLGGTTGCSFIFRGPSPVSAIPTPTPQGEFARVAPESRMRW